MVYSHLEFRADYPRAAGEAGREVMERLIAAMRHAGFEAAQPVAEDWGWACTLSAGGFSLLLGCGAYAEYEDGWLCFVEGAKRGVKRLLHPGAVRALRQKAVTTMHGAIAADPLCRDLKWWTDDTGVGPLVDAA
jgi:AcrR family transcriptional regulator